MIQAARLGRAKRAGGNRSDRPSQSTLKRASKGTGVAEIPCIEQPAAGPVGGIPPTSAPQSSLEPDSLNGACRATEDPPPLRSRRAITTPMAA